MCLTQKAKVLPPILHSNLTRSLRRACLLLALLLACHGLGWSQQCSDTQFIQRAYSDLLLRQPNAGEIEFYLPAVQSMGRQAVAASLTGSQEYSLNLIGGNPGVVAGFYQNFLGRNPSPSEAAATLALEPTTSDSKIIASLLGSSEYHSRATALNPAIADSNAQLVNQMFLDLLGRNATASELILYDAQLASSVTPAAVANTILSSDEYSTKLIQQAYLRLLHRPPTQTEISAFLTPLKSDSRPEEDLLDVVAGAPEYCNETVKPPPVFVLVAPAETIDGLNSVTVPQNLGQLPAVQFGPVQAAADASVLGLQVSVTSDESTITSLNSEVTRLSDQISALQAMLASQTQLVTDLTNALFGAPAALDVAEAAQKDAQKRGQALHYKVAKIANAGLPRFSLGKRSIANTLVNVVEKMAGKPAAAIAVDTQNFPELAKHYWLKGSDNGAVLSFLSPEKIKFLENINLPGTIATNSQYLVYFERGSLRSAQDYDSFIETLDQLAANML